ncbi:MAG: hypothetical protein A2Y67_01700 [Candidatus Buchananbacteria bacterium RBG_13_39_9]|uniref:Uncharacterized protein n=1 Tax=Candidatus Buchananbacteria bacterium RBG_13_39_9 TaxID=1797531 RepID=A0A1G1XQD3_9BACT|nr:MAG: hypothetical protein A2Y67_01700 [Candidatus Buchananbacteria bacterium RBG_13_39_9]
MNYFRIIFGGVIGAIVAGPILLIYHFYSGTYSYVLDGVVKNLGGKSYIYSSLYLIMLFIVLSFVTSIVFCLIYAGFEYKVQNKNASSLLLLLFSGIYLFLAAVPVDLVGRSKIETDFNLALIIGALVLFLALGFILNYFSFRGKK